MMICNPFTNLGCIMTHFWFLGDIGHIVVLFQSRKRRARFSRYFGLQRTICWHWLSTNDIGVESPNVCRCHPVPCFGSWVLVGIWEDLGSASFHSWPSTSGKNPEKPIWRTSIDGRRTQVDVKLLCLVPKWCRKDSSRLFCSLNSSRSLLTSSSQVDENPNSQVFN